MCMTTQLQVAQADAEAAHLDKMAADQKVARIAASKLAAETALEDSETAHLDSVKKAARATRVKQTAEEVAALASSRADAAAKVTIPERHPSERDQTVTSGAVRD